MREAARPRRLLLIGADGADPDILQRLLAAGDLPHLAGLQAAGTWGRLSTTLPAVSPVAWTSLLTGCWPAAHGILDFVIKAPGGYHPTLGLYRTEAGPAGATVYRSRRTAPTLAEQLTARGLTSYLLHIPGTFPATELRGGMLTGLGTPDLLGTFGAPALTVTDPARLPAEIRRRTDVTALTEEAAGSWLGSIAGPAGARLTLRLTREETGYTLGWEPAGQLHLEPDAWSAWQTLRFGPVAGICRFYLWREGEALFLYRTPLHPDPAAPAVPLCWPADFAPRLARRLGPFPTASFPMEQAGYQDGLLPASAFLAGAYQVWEEQARLAETLAAQDDWSFLAAHFFTADSLQHLFWPDVEGVIAAGYRWLDAVVGRLRRAAGPATAVIVASDHGVAPADQWFHLNAWLRQAGYLDADAAGRIRWESTRAFGLGYAGVHLNVRGREPRGSVEQGRPYTQLREEIAGRLLALRDPADGAPIVQSAVPRERLFSGQYMNALPDLIVTLRRGVALGRADARGQAPADAALLEPNRSRWRAGHEGPHDPAEVAGVWLAAGPDIAGPRRADAQIIDVAPLILSLLGPEN